MKIILLSSSVHGCLGHHLPVLANCKDIEIAMVVVSRGVVVSRSKRYSRIIKKMGKIGIAGALNGMKMRKWYNEDIKQYSDTGDAEAFCKANNIPFSWVPATNSKDTQNIFKESGAVLGISLGNGFISTKVFTVPQYGMLNIHHELLPEYQNAQSIIWEIYNGSKQTGYTIHKISKEIDKGDILLKQPVPITFRETLADTVAFNYAKLYDESAVGLVKVLSDFNNYFSKAIPQGSGTHYTTPSFAQYSKIKKQFRRLSKEQ